MRAFSQVLCCFLLSALFASVAAAQAISAAERERTFASPAFQALQQSQAPRTKGGTPQDLQQFVCELYNADKHRMQAMALEELPRIGGWYSIQLYRELLSPSALIKYRKAPTKPDNRDTATKEPVWWSLTSLPKVAPNPPPIEPPDSSFDSAKIRQHAQIWRDWIQANDVTLKTLQPTGEGVDFSGRRCPQTLRIQMPVQRR
jgi:hypothetical protein